MSVQAFLGLCSIRDSLWFDGLDPVEEDWAGPLRPILGSHTGIYLEFLSRLEERVMGFAETDHRGQGLPHHFMSREQALKTLITVDVNFGHRGEVVCQFSCCVLKPFLTAPVNPDHPLF